MTRSTLSVRLRLFVDGLAGARPNGASRRPARQPTALVRFVLIQALVGSLLGVATACAMLLTNTADLRSLILKSDDVLTPLIMLLVGFAITIGGLYVASAVMLHDGGE
jgi:hypothetical protein